MSWLEAHLSTILSFFISGAGLVGAYYRLKYRVRAEATAPDLKRRGARIFLGGIHERVSANHCRT